jgi:DNA polymerase
MDKNIFLQSLKSLLYYHHVSGIESYPKNSELAEFLRYSPAPAPPQGVVASPEKPKQGQGAGRRMVAAVEKSPVSLAEIAEEVAACRACGLHKLRLYPVAGRGPEKVRLMIVGDWLASDSDGQLPPGQLFGVEQDLMLARMLAAIHLPPASVFITNVIKCSVPAACQPQAEHVQSCISFLRRQIGVLKPEIICTMGMVAARATLEKSLPLSRLRGRVHWYEVTKEVKIPVVTTYHPTYLLQNPEMKTATWQDLQMLAKELAK